MPAALSAWLALPGHIRLASVEPAVVQKAGEILRRPAVISEIAFVFSRERHAHLVVKIVGPHSVEPCPAAIFPHHQLTGVTLVLRNQESSTGVGELGQFRQKMSR